MLPYVRAVGLLSLAALASGCGADASTTLRALGSWAATGAMAAQAWADDAIPREYTTRTLDRVKRELAEQERELGTLSASTRTAVTPITARVVRSTREMTDAVRAGDRGRTRALAEMLGAEARRLQQLAAGAPGPS
jgi:hypothetical protein